MGRGIYVCWVGLLLGWFSCGQAAWGQYGGGSGTAGSPYEIWTAEQMNAIGANPGHWNNHFILMANIDLSAYTGNSYNIIGISMNSPFTGTFDGNHHQISNFTYFDFNVAYTETVV